MLVTIVVCKCHPKFTSGGAQTGTDGGKGGVNDPTYMEIDGGEGRSGGNTFQLKENEAYATNVSL